MRAPASINACVVRRVRRAFFALFHGEREKDLQQGDELEGKCGLSEIVLLRFDLTPVEEDHGVGGRPVIVLHDLRFFHFAAHRSCGSGGALVKASRPAGHDSEGPVEPLYALGHHRGLVD